MSHPSFESYIIDDSLFERIYNISFKDNRYISRHDLRYLSITHIGFDQKPHPGEIICNKIIADDLLSIFKELYDARYEIERVHLIDEYMADDKLSMAHNNSSCFNFRTIAGTDRLSRHALGMAIDINPLYNPYVRQEAGAVLFVDPPEGKDFASRSRLFPHKIDHDDFCYRLFTSHGFNWGGDWINYQDYQHFEKN